MSKLLIVAQAVAPIGGSHSTRVTNFVRHLSAMGWDVTILTTCIYKGTPNLDADLFDKFPPNLTFVYSYPGPMHALSYRKLSSRPNRASKSSSLLKKVLIPDTYIEWLPGACFSAIKHYKKKSKPDVILSSAVPYTSHLIALILSKLWHVPFVADYGDPT